ncbi:MAG: N-acetylglucosamine-6-phosphate deacetylase [Flavisolibacter sp.]|nr:N-acetylglucosamine-6-phosphate deacetylase [Flavisolibacter sp.]
MQVTTYLPGRIFTGVAWLERHAVVVKNGTIEAVIAATEIQESDSVIEWPDCILAPAFIDIQIYGAYERLFAVYPEPQSLHLLAEYCRKGGATLFLPTLATNSLDVFHKGIDAVRAYWQQGGKGVYGLHLEGPWINEAKKGAHIQKYIHEPTVEEVKALLDYGRGVIKMITLAPEKCCDEVLKLIIDENIIISAGHSNATYDQAVKSFEQGIKTVTHLFNAMSPLEHRNPGLVGAVLNHTSVRSSIIPDGYHVDWPAIQIAKKIMGERLFVITDAVTQTTAGGYQHLLEGDRYTCNGTLSGSALTMHKAFYNLVYTGGFNTGEALRMCSLYPAQVLGCDSQYGKMAPGYLAQFVVLNQKFDLMEVIT